MTMTADAQQLDGIARALNRREWIPSQEEVAVGAAFLQEVQAADAGQSFPRVPGTDDRLRTVDVAVLVTLVSRIEEVLLPLWRLPRASPVIDLVELYVRGAQPIMQQADAVLAA
ncbi:MULTISPECIES: hypothetical protein [unclassified Streptomyces]|uniref:hypothetical protein n=1 Tax=unclassified Streptomyces TaxID=2593676 RepID=UPI001CD537DC|nr:hypothetical protein [Streptomyces sp. CoH27]